MKKNTDDPLIMNRNFLKDNLRLEINFLFTDQNKGLPAPPLEKPPLKNQKIIKLPPPQNITDIKNIGLIQAIKKRKSFRNFLTSSFTLDEISFLLWATQGLRGKTQGECAYRVVPSAGCRHSFETYIIAMNIKDLNEGIYRYLPVEHGLVVESQQTHLSEKMIQATLGQGFVGNAAAVFIWSSIPYRMEWRYSLAAHRVIAFDIGHVCQNLYLAVQVISAGTCALAAYDQELMDELLGLDGISEFVMYLAAIGKIKNE
jgi:SagB-type dehydrogenase family enzyme